MISFFLKFFLTYVYLYIIQIFLDESEIKSVDCECPRGNYKCSHVAALIIHGIHNLSQTSGMLMEKQKAPDQVKSME